MAVSRGQIYHSLSEDISSLFTALLSHHSSRKSEFAKGQISHFFAPSDVIFMPYARTALYAILHSLDLPRGSKILMTPFNIEPMLDVIYSLGLEPVFVDINHTDFGPCISGLEESLKTRPACFLLTYLFGYVPDLKKITDLCKAHNVPLIEDFSQAIGATFQGKSVGTFGHASFYSCSLGKFVDGYNGCLLLAHSSPLAAKLRTFESELKQYNPVRLIRIILRTCFWNLALGPFVFSFFTYPALWVLKTCNPRLFEAILGPSISSDTRGVLPSFYFEKIAPCQIYMINKKLKQLIARVQQRRNDALHFFIESRNPNYHQIISFEQFNHVYWQMPLPVTSTESARNLLFDNGIETGTTNLPNLAALEGVELPRAAAIKTRFIFFPIHRRLSSSRLKRIFQLPCFSEVLVDG